MPKSRVRKKAVYTPPPRSARRKVSPPWVAPAMVACLVLGLVWIALYYITNGDLAGMSVLGFWNLVIGFVLIIAGVVLSTQWREPASEGGQPQKAGRPRWPLHSAVAAMRMASIPAVAAAWIRTRWFFGA